MCKDYLLSLLICGEGQVHITPLAVMGYLTETDDFRKTVVTQNV